jgi:hypothetical protein
MGLEKQSKAVQTKPFWLLEFVGIMCDSKTDDLFDKP